VRFRGVLVACGESRAARLRVRRARRERRSMRVKSCDRSSCRCTWSCSTRPRGRARVMRSVQVEVELRPQTIDAAPIGHPSRRGVPAAANRDRPRRGTAPWAKHRAAAPRRSRACARGKPSATGVSRWHRMRAVTSTVPTCGARSPANSPPPSTVKCAERALAATTDRGNRSPRAARFQAFCRSAHPVAAAPRRGPPATPHASLLETSRRLRPSLPATTSKTASTTRRRSAP